MVESKGQESQRQWRKEIPQISVVDLLSTAPIHHRTWQDKSRWVQVMRTGKSVLRGLMRKPAGLVCTAPLLQTALSSQDRLCLSCVCSSQQNQIAIMILLAVQAPEARSWRKEDVQQGGRLLRRHSERCASGTSSRARAEMTSVTRSVAKSGWELSQRMWHCSRGAESAKGRISGQSRVGGGSSSTL